MVTLLKDCNDILKPGYLEVKNVYSIYNPQKRTDPITVTCSHHLG